ncbi:efflux RND transporter periplasmic adaptor subunit [Sphingomonas sp.]|uniref:efflux RND transporter periplasmic adaptor subunit n=1 Tax=Sphingomonas sp. TaxID=28214 RepID=UPI00286E93D6|nr:efflux RND transporter periplasmic adaptor subunit [Sphingomonas sp.]
MTFDRNTDFHESGAATRETLIVRLRRQPPAARAALIALPLLALAALIYWMVAGGAQPAPAMPPAEVAVATPLQRNIFEYEEFTGRFEPSRSVEIRPRVSGQLQSLHFRDGDFVRQGQLLFSIDPRPFAAALAEAQARAAAARTAAALAQAELVRALRLLPDEAVSREEVDNLRAVARSAEANIAANDAVVRQRALDVEFTRVRAPISGRISYRRTDPGTLVSGGNSGAATLLTTINAVDPIHFTFDVSEASLLKAQRERAAGAGAGQAQQVDIRLQDEPDYRWHGRIDFTDNGIDPSSGTIRARATIANRDGFLTPGMFGNMRLAARGPVTALLVPDSAVLTDQAGKMVMTIGPNGQPRPIPVVVGPVIDGLRVIKSGLAANAKVIIRGHQRMMPGAPIKPKLTRIVPQRSPSSSPAAAPPPASSASFGAN